MRRGAKVTVPFNVCLFAAVSLVMLLAGGTMAYRMLREQAAARPDLAYKTLSQTLDEVQARLADHFEAPREFVQLSRHWIQAGTLNTDGLTRWSTILLPPLADLEQVSGVAVHTNRGMIWYARRGTNGWSGGWHEPVGTPGLSRRASWDRLGRPRRGTIESVTFDAERYEDLLASMNTNSESTDFPLVVRPPLSDDGRTTYILATSLGDILGSTGLVALELHGPEYAYTRPAGIPEVTVHADPGGRRLRHLARSQTLPLLTAQAVPGSANVALETLFPVPDETSATRWYVARSYPLADDFTWWSVASVSGEFLPAASVNIKSHAIAGLLAGLAGAVLVAIFLGRKISAPLRTIARRAQSVYAIDEHYLPWPKSRFTEINTLTDALEDLYEDAVEHLDYHDAPLIVWAQEEALSGKDGIVDAEPLKRHINLRGANGAQEAAAPEQAGPVINVPGQETAPPAVPAAQLQVLHGSRREVRRLQGQLAGAVEELRSKDAYYRESETRMRRQRQALRALDKELHRQHAVTVTALEVVRDALEARGVSLWRCNGEPAAPFKLQWSTESQPATTSLPGSVVLRALLKEELVVSARDLRQDPRLTDFRQLEPWQSQPGALLLAPLRFRAALIGFLLVERPVGTVPWKADEEAFISSCAIQCTMMIGARQRNGSVRLAMPGVMPIGRGERKGVNESPKVYWETDLAGCIKFVRGDVFRVYGYEPEALLDQPVTFLSDREQGEMDLAQLRRVLGGAPCVGYETCHQTAGGDRITLAVRAELQRDATGRIVGVQGEATLSAVPVT